MKLTYIELKGEQHPLCYNLAAIEEICDEFGSPEDMAKLMDKGSRAEQIKTINKALKFLMNGGRAYCAEMGIEMPEKINNPAALIDASSPEAVQAIFSAIKRDKETEVEVISKNVEAAQGI